MFLKSCNFVADCHASSNKCLHLAAYKQAIKRVCFIKKF